MSAVKLPKKLNGYLEELTGRVRKLAVTAAISRALLILPISALLFILGDAYFGFPIWLRSVMFGGWTLLAIRELTNITWALTAKIDAERIAHDIEAEYPRMGERLTTAVELSKHADESNGSPELIREVLRDAQNRTERLDFERVFPQAPVRRELWTALFAFFVILLPLAFVPIARERAGRFFAPWYVPALNVDYKIVVTSGSPAVKRGDSVTLTAYVEAVKAGATLPSSANLVVVANGREDRLAMTADETTGIFRLTRPSADGDFDYRVEAGLAVSETNRVVVVEPITLTKASMTIVPPAYARPANDTSMTVVDGLGELLVLEHGKINFELKFSPLPKSVVLEFAPENGDKSSRRKQTVVCNDKGEANLVWVARKSGVFQLIAEGERGVKSELPPQPLRVIADEAPKFPRVAGLHEKSKSIRPTEMMKLDVTATDDIAVGSLMLEFRINEGPIQTRPLKAVGLNSPQVDGKLLFDISSLVKNGDQFEARLKASDNRNIPELKLEPQTTYYPAKDWADFRVRADALPLAEQDIVQRKLDIETKLKEIRDDLKSESRTTYALRRSLANKRTATPEELERLAKTRDELEKTTEKARDLADDTAVVPELRKLAEAIRKLEEGELRTATQSLAASRETQNSGERNKKLAAGDDAIESALKQLDELLNENERLAKDRLDKRKLQDLADEQRTLAEKAKDAKPEQADDLKKRQEELQQLLKQLRDQSESIQKAVNAAKGGESEKLAAEADKLAKEIRELDAAIEKSNQGPLADRLERLKKKQEELTQKTTEFGNRTDNASRAAQSAPLKTDEASKNALNRGDLDEAAKQQEKTAQELDRFAKEMEQAANKINDPREVAGQLAQAQEMLRERLAKETKTKPLDQLSKKDREELIRQQESIANAAGKLKTPAGNTPSEVARQRAVADAKKAADSLKQNAGEMAERRMRDAKKSLDELVEKLPTEEQRVANAKSELNKLRAEQETLRQDVEKAVKESSDKPDELRKKLAEQSKKEADLAERLKSAESTGLEKSVAQAASELSKAASDLTAGKKDEIAKSQESVRQSLEKLEQALNQRASAEPKESAPTKTPRENADIADRLAKAQRELADASAKAAEQFNGKTGDAIDRARKEARESLNQRQYELTRQLSELDRSKSAKARQQTEQAMSEARGELARENFAGAAKLQRDAAEALDRLSRESRDEDARKQSERKADLPNKEQADEARRLAREQRELRDESMRVNDELRKQNNRTDNPAGELAKEQDRLAKQARDLAQKSAERQGEQSEAAKEAGTAADAAEQGAKKLQTGELPDARQAGERAKASLDQLAKASQGTESGQKAADLARRQDDLNKKLGELSKDPGASRVQQRAREFALADQAKQLGEQLEKLVKEGSNQPDSEAAKQAGQNAKQAAQQLKAAGEADQNNQNATAREAREKAANSLAQAAKASREMAGKPKNALADASPQAGEAVQKADQQMKQAAGQLGQKNTGEAGNQMAEAARSLEQAANQLGQGQNQPGNPGDPTPGQGNRGNISGTNVGGPGGTPDLRSFPADIAKHNGKPWGELPGEIRTKIIQQMSARYGEDYARNIKLYFEQLAERK